MQRPDDTSAQARRRTHPASGVAVVGLLAVVTVALLTVSGLNARIDRLERERDSLRRSLSRQAVTRDDQQRLWAKVPDVVGLPLEGAERVIESVGLQPVVDPSTPPGSAPIVVVQTPPPGTNTTVGNRVALTLAG